MDPYRKIGVLSIPPYPFELLRNKVISNGYGVLQDFMNEYAKTHTKKETDRHFHELTVKPAKRTYVSGSRDKNKTSPKFKCGDVVKIKKKGKSKVKAITVCCVRNSRNTVADKNDKQVNFKYCTTIRRKSLEFVKPKP